MTEEPEMRTSVMRNPELVEAMINGLVVAMLDGGFRPAALREMAEYLKDAAAKLDAFRSRMETFAN